MRLSVAACLGFLLIPVTWAQAQTVEMRALVERANKDAPSPSAGEVKQAVAETLRAASVAYGWCNPREITIVNVKPATADATIYFAVKAGQASNAWTAAADVTGCPGEDRLRMLLIRTPNALKAIQISGGNGLASFSETRDALLQAKAAALIFAARFIAGCTQQSTATLSRTSVVQSSSNEQAAYYGVLFKGDWTEAWTFKVCDAAVEVPVRFRADGTGGAFFDIAVAAAKKASP